MSTFFDSGMAMMAAIVFDKLWNVLIAVFLFRSYAQECKNEIKVVTQQVGVPLVPLSHDVIFSKGLTKQCFEATWPCSKTRKVQYDFSVTLAIIMIDYHTLYEVNNVYLIACCMTLDPLFPTVSCIWIGLSCILTNSQCMGTNPT